MFTLLILNLLDIFEKFYLTLLPFLWLYKFNFGFISMSFINLSTLFIFLLFTIFNFSLAIFRYLEWCCFTIPAILRARNGGYVHNFDFYPFLR